MTDDDPSFRRLMLTVSFWVGIAVAYGLLLATLEFFVPESDAAIRVFFVGMAVGIALSWTFDGTVKMAKWEAKR